MEDDSILTGLLTDAIVHAGDPLEAEMPSGRVLRRLAKRRFVRMLQQEQLREAMPTPPAPGESAHLVSNAKADFATWIPQIIEWSGALDFLYCSTWTLSRPNALEIFALYDARLIARGQLHFLTGLYFKRRETATYNLLLAGLVERGGRFKAFENHCKILLAGCAARDLWITVEASANLNANPRFEQYVLTNDRALLEFHRGWMEEVFAAPARQYRSTTMRGETASHAGYSHRRAGLGVTTATNDPASRRALLRQKAAPFPDPAALEGFAEAVAEVIRHWLPIPPPGAVITVPPQGASWPGDYYADGLAKAAARRLRLPFAVLLERTDDKARHGPHAALAQAPFRFTGGDRPPAAVLVDDLITSGATMKLSLAALADAGVPAYGFAYNGA